MSKGLCHFNWDCPIYCKNVVVTFLVSQHIIFYISYVILYIILFSYQSLEEKCIVSKKKNTKSKFSHAFPNLALFWFCFLLDSEANLTTVVI